MKTKFCDFLRCTRVFHIASTADEPQRHLTALFCSRHTSYLNKYNFDLPAKSTLQRIVPAGSIDNSFVVSRRRGRGERIHSMRISTRRRLVIHISGRRLFSRWRRHKTQDRRQKGGKKHSQSYQCQRGFEM
ncbi:hypothetical protein JJE65_04495 [Alloprevotella tannerae]|uniref:hypothetical protein n=1 Tax=Alloprevotella tannerae TaxID=76122 RepID=UPI001EDAB64F|nr:hypothetical protein [Alloprevotella tannerae]MCG2648660.1 hypothetical protein [Alloprevotella tannerae]